MKIPIIDTDGRVLGTNDGPCAAMLIHVRGDIPPIGTADDFTRGIRRHWEQEFYIADLGEDGLAYVARERPYEVACWYTLKHAECGHVEREFQCEKRLDVRAP